MLSSTGAEEYRHRFIALKIKREKYVRGKLSERFAPFVVMGKKVAEGALNIDNRGECDDIFTFTGNRRG